MSVFLQSESQNTLQLSGAVSQHGYVQVSCSAAAVVISAQVQSIYQKAYAQIMQTIQPYVSSINTKTADQTGTLLLLGSQCISIVDSGDTTDLQSTPSDQHTINIFDGCKACNDCQAVWQIIQAVQQLHIWIVGLKDCVLYYQPTAQALWTKLNEGRQSGADITDQSGKCRYTPRIYSRQQQFGRATKLLYQYKAAVAMWNYLVYNLSSKMVIQPALQDYTGFSVKIKRRFNLCDCADSSKGATLTIYITRTGQQISGTTERQTEQTQQEQQSANQGTQQSDASLINSVPYALGFYVGLVPQNTYIQTHTDKGGFSQHNSAVQHYESDADTGISHQLSPINYSANGISIVSTVSYAFSSEDNGQYVCSAELKILPVMLSGQVSVERQDDQYVASITEPDNPTQSLSLSQYTMYRRRNSTLSDDLLAQTNRWQIHACWQGGCTSADTSDATYYRTSYNLYPNVDIIQSIARNMVDRAETQE